MTSYLYPDSTEKGNLSAVQDKFSSYYWILQLLLCTHTNEDPSSISGLFFIFIKMKNFYFIEDEWEFTLGD